MYIQEYFSKIEIVMKKASELKDGDLVWMAGMIMVFNGFVKGSPVFLHFSDRSLCYHNLSLTAESLIETI